MIIRDFEVVLAQRVQEKHPLVQVLVGPRQVGKTTAVKRIYEAFSSAKVFVSADSPTPFSADWLETHWLRARSLAEPTLLVVDEVQKVIGWSEVVKKLFDEDRGKRDLRVVLLGSASLSLQSGLRESLAGRFELLSAHHWSFAEHLQHAGWDIVHYLKFGGYPTPANLIADKERWLSYIRDSIIEPVIGRDISTITEISKPALLRQVFEIAMHYPAQEVSYQKLVGQLQERGSAQTVKHYLEILAGAFLVQQVFKYSTRPLSTRESSPKLVPLAPALIHAFSDPLRIEVDPEWRGRVFESVIGAALMHAKGKVFTWRERNHEVDFIYQHNPQTIFAIEVKSGRRKASSGLNEFLRRHPKAQPVIISMENYQMLLSGKPVLAALNELAKSGL